MKSKPKGLIKREFSDFVVLEIAPDGSTLPLIQTTNLSNGHATPDTYALLVMTKVGVSAERAQEAIAAACGISPNEVTSFGKKDAWAVTSQLIAVPAKCLPATFEHPQIFLQHWGYTSEPLQTARHSGNHFNILVVTKAGIHDFDADAIRRVPNYYGPQRFRGENSWEVGRLLFEGKFEEARAKLCDQGYQRTLEQALAHNDNNLSRAWLSDECTRMLKFSLSQWKSHLWNTLLRELHEKGTVPDSLPSWSVHPRARAMYEHLWSPASLDTWVLGRSHDFSRPTWIEPWNLSFRQDQDGIRFIFNLRSGAYATTVLEQAFDLEEAGTAHS